MPFIKSIYFHNHKETLALIEFHIQSERLDRFRNSFATDKWITSYQWDYIFEKINANISQVKQQDTDWSTLRSSYYPKDMVGYKIICSFIKKNEGIIDVTSLKDYTFDWILKVRIERESSRSKERKPDKSLKENSTHTTENNATSDIESKASCQSNPDVLACTSNSVERSSSVEAGKGQVTEDQTNSVNLVESESDHDQVQINFDNVTTRFKAKIVELKNKRRMSASSSSEAEIKEDGDQAAPSTNTRKRKLFKHESSRQSLMDNFLSKPKTDNESKKNLKEKKENGVQKKVAKEKSKTPLKASSSNFMDQVDKNQYKRLVNFLDQMKKDEIHNDRRKQELEDYQILHCRDVDDSDLKVAVLSMRAEIVEYFDQIANSQTTKFFSTKYDISPIYLTTSGILTQKQCMFIMSEIEKLREMECRGTKEHVLSDIALPCVIIEVFKRKHKLDAQETLQRLKTQKEKEELFREFSQTN